MTEGNEDETEIADTTDGYRQGDQGHSPDYPQTSTLGVGKKFLKQRERSKLKIKETRRLQYRKHAA